MSTEERRIIAEAAQWLAFFQSGAVDSARDHAFLDWQAQDPRHAKAIDDFRQRLASFQRSPLRDLSQAQVINAINTSSSRRRFLRGAFAFAGLAMGTGLLSRLGSTGFAWPGDLYTGIGERGNFLLEDGSSLSLNAASRVTPRFDDAHRGFRFHRGEFLLEVRQQTQPFVVETNGGSVRSTGLGMLLREEHSGWLVSARQAPLEFIDRNRHRHAISSGHWLRYGVEGIRDTGLASAGEGAWQRGLLNVENLSLGEVVERLRPYHRGVLNIDSSITGLRVSGIFPLDDSAHALAMLASILPIKVTRTTDFWVVLQPS